MPRKNEPSIPSPCIDNCCLDDDICMGCFRTIQEIMDWGEADAQGRLGILRWVEVRKRGEKSFKFQVRKS